MLTVRRAVVPLQGSAFKALSYKGLYKVIWTAVKPSSRKLMIHLRVCSLAGVELNCFCPDPSSWPSFCYQKERLVLIPLASHPKWFEACFSRCLLWEQNTWAIVPGSSGFNLLKGWQQSLQSFSSLGLGFECFFPSRSFFVTVRLTEAYNITCRHNRHMAFGAVFSVFLNPSYFPVRNYSLSWSCWNESLGVKCCQFETVRCLAKSFLPNKIWCKTSTPLEESLYCGTLSVCGDCFLPERSLLSVYANFSKKRHPLKLRAVLEMLPSSLIWWFTETTDLWEHFHARASQWAACAGRCSELWGLHNPALQLL